MEPNIEVTSQNNMIPDRYSRAILFCTIFDVATASAQLFSPVASADQKLQGYIWNKKKMEVYALFRAHLLRRLWQSSSLLHKV